MSIPKRHNTYQIDGLLFSIRITDIIISLYPLLSLSSYPIMLINGPSIENPDFFKEKYELFKDRQELIRHLKSLVSNTKALDILSKRCYHHSNGFDKIVLFYNGRQFPSVRLHVWWYDAPRALHLDIHSHPWNFQSFIITGNITNNIYKLALPNQGDYYYEHLIIQNQQHSGANSINKNKPATLQLERTQEYYQNDEYFLTNDLLHDIYVEPRVTAITLIYQTEFIVNDCYLFTKKDSLAIEAVRFYTNEELVSLIYKIVNYLE